MVKCRTVFVVLFTTFYVQFFVHSEELLAPNNNLTLESNSCSNGSDNCSDTSDMTVSIAQDVLAVTMPGATLEGDNITASSSTELDTNLTTPETTNATDVKITTLPAYNVTSIAAASNTTLQGNKTLVPNVTAIETTTIAIDLTSIANTSALREPQPSLFPTNGICSCDLTMNLCDNNCCCDTECSREDRLVFTSCHQRLPYALDPRYCYQTQFIYRNNTELKMAWFQDGLFCILEDNLPVTVHYRNRNKVSSLKEYNLLHDGRRTFSWPVHSMKQLEFKPLIRYTAGGAIWSFKEGTLVPLGLPIKVANSFCQSSKPVQYLQDISSSCSHPSPNLVDCESSEDFDAASYYRNITILASPEFVNQTEPNLLLEQCLNNSCISITAALCLPGLETPHLDTCKESTNILSPVASLTLGMCQNVVKRIRYVIHHNGTAGLIKVYAYFTLANISLSSASQGRFTQYFSVEFRWANEQKIFKRSGRPGYLIGKPVMAGRKITHISKVENGNDKAGIELSDNPMHWLSLPSVKRDGTCDMIFKHVVTFGDDRRVTCRLPLVVSNFSTTSNCALLQKQIFLLLAGDAINNVTEVKQFNKYVATFGDSRVEDVGDWVQVLLMNLPSVVTTSTSKNNNQLLSCKSIISSMHIDVVFAKVGALANPQAKILGVAFIFGKPQDLVFPCNGVQCPSIGGSKVEYFQLLSSISFVDVTQPAETYFSEPPVYEVKLAYDFFYPFFSGAVIPKLNIMCFLVASLISLGKAII